MICDERCNLEIEYIKLCHKFETLLQSAKEQGCPPQCKPMDKHCEAIESCDACWDEWVAKEGDQL